MKKQRQPLESPADRIEREQADAAVARHKTGYKLTAREMRAIRIEEARREERSRWEHYETIPKKHYREMSGRQAKIIDAQARLYGMPTLGRVVSLPAILRWLHDFLAEKAHVLKGSDDVDMQGDGEAAERYRLAKAGQEDIKLRAMQGQYSQNDQILGALGIYQAGIREGWRKLLVKFPGAGGDIERAIENAEERARDYLLAEMSKSGPLPADLAAKVKPKRALKKAPKKTKGRRNK